MPKHTGYSSRVQKAAGNTEPAIKRLGTGDTRRLGAKPRDAGKKTAPENPPAADQYKENAGAKRIPRDSRSLV
jgi:hypothetical protein